ncbi:peptide chain release factor N(5)-glutamine methyltransferase [Gordonia sp. NPDC003424]
MTTPDPSAGGRVDVELSWATTVLAEAGVESARVDAEWLLAAVLEVDRGRLLILDDLDPDAVERFRAAVRRRAQRIPLQHIIGTASFGPAELAVGPGVFTPRPETEVLLEWAVREMADTAEPCVADLCGGSGALAIGIALAVPTARVWVVERSADALTWLRRNVDHALGAGTDRITVVAADVTDAVAVTRAIPAHSLDVVVSNPPYVPLGTAVPPEVDHDPPEAVFAGDDGMSVIGPMASVIARILRPGGAMGIEHDESTSAAVLAAVEATHAFSDIRARDDLTGRPRFVTGRRRR